MRFLYLALAVLLITSCRQKAEKPDVSKIKVTADLHRFDKDFFSMDTTKLSASLEGLYKKYPDFLPLYFEFLTPVNIMRQQGRSYTDAVSEYFRNMKSLYDSAQKKYADFSVHQKGLEEGMRYVKYYFPTYRLPPVITTVEGLNPEDPQEIYGTSYYHDTLIISLQMFLGKDFVGYDPTQYFDYIRRRFEPEFVVPAGIRAIASAIYPDSSSDASLIEQMIEKGKQWYLVDHFLPDTPDSLKTFYTARQLEWCRANEGNIWGAIMANTPDLYTVDKDRIQAYIGEAPFTQDMQHEYSPGNIGQWVGWQIVNKFVDRNPKLSPDEVVHTPARKIFNEAKYRPK